MDEASYVLKQAAHCRRMAAHLGELNGQPLLQMGAEHEAPAGDLHWMRCPGVGPVWVAPLGFMDRSAG
jgi:hypothetical protein